jgi:hypothetical protein
MPFNKRTANQDKLMEETMVPADQDPSLLQAQDVIVEGQDAARLRRILKYTDNAGKSQLGLPTPDLNKARPRKPKS